jgi:hypothetical protein
MECGRAEELLSDHRDGTLEDPLRSELEAHLAECAGCRELRGALEDVLAALASFPVPAPAVDLASRAAEAALRRGRPPTRLLTRRFQGVPARVQAVAALLAVALTGLVLWAASPGAASRAIRLKERSVNAGVYLLERKDRLVEDLRILRVLVGTALGSRVGSVSDRVEDYRRLLERKRTAGEPRKTGGVPAPAASRRFAQLPEQSGPRARNV